LKADEWDAALAARLRPLLERMRAGEDVPPAQWHRAEGFAEAGLAGAITTPAALAGLIEALYAEQLGAGCEATFGVPAIEWLDAEGQVRLRFRLPRAPVFVGGSG
jgi:hypothetical protein